MHPIIASYLAQAATTAPLIREGFRTKPTKNSAGGAKRALTKAAAERGKQLNPDLKHAVMFDEGHINIDDLAGTLKYAGMNAKGRGGTSGQDSYPLDRISYNPNADSAILAHELGHTVSRHTDIGDTVSKLRHNPKLAMALAIASGIIPTAAAVMTPGDDEYDETMAASLALSLPTLVDEGLATKNALAMMNTAGMRASLGQRAKLAGGFLSYVSAPLISASLGTALGNQFDEDIPVV